MHGALAPLAIWQNFYVIIGSAAATLTGLMFIVITLIAGMRARIPSAGDGIAIFSTPTVVHFCSALLIAAIICAPWQAFWNVSLLLSLLGLAGMAYIFIVLRRVRHRQIDYQPVLEDWLWHTILPLVSYTSLVIAALLLSLYPAPTLFVIAGATVLFLFIGIHNAWDNVTYTVIEFSQPQDKSQD